ncbi:transcriptional regulator, AraC family [Pseudomonas sp. LAMO17WK12:I10]|nr:AraC-like DNA-binding protein [Pseudomonas sp. LAMO17WK12:I9]SNY51863.1 transcriptional regulator, AraC family [Pseudomonas sp. LAMO17WK12:I10]
MQPDSLVDQETWLEDWDLAVGSHTQVLRVRNGLTPLCLAHRDSGLQWCFPPGWHGLLATRPGVRRLSGMAHVMPTPACLVKLQFFVDCGAARPLLNQQVQPLCGLRIDDTSETSAMEIESWYVTQAWKNSSVYKAFSCLLRESESYRLLQFLLEHASAGEKLQDLAPVYGVSVSHFRRLCHQALGGTAKSELRDWRVAKALLSMVEGAHSLTSIAYEHGYSSSSHFSKEIRDLVGVAPSHLVDIIRLSSE